MKTRWLAGLAIFALGFGCAHVMRVTTAEASDDGMLDEGLQVIEHDNRFELINSGIHRYLLYIKPKAGATVAGPADLSAMSGSASVPKQGLESVTVIRMTALAELAPGQQPPERDCRPDFENCVGPEPILPPRPPKKTWELDPSFVKGSYAFTRP